MAMSVLRDENVNHSVNKNGTALKHELQLEADHETSDPRSQHDAADVTQVLIRSTSLPQLICSTSSGPTQDFDMGCSFGV
jgi:hypothetical protein